MDNASIKAAMNWWRSISLPIDQLKAKGLYPAPSAHKATIKRCNSLDGIMLTEGFRSLWLSLPEDIINSDKKSIIECWALIAGVLVYVKDGKSENIAKSSGAKKDGSDKSIVSELRFSQLQSAKTAEDFYRRLRRVIQQLDGKVSPESLMKDIDTWFREQDDFYPRKPENRLAVNWAMDYYRAAAQKSK
jgi:CRISPR system Cascade subunit CasB